MKAGSAAHASPDIVRDTPFLSLWSWCCLQGFITVTKAVSDSLFSIRRAFEYRFTWVTDRRRYHTFSRAAFEIQRRYSVRKVLLSARPIYPAGCCNRRISRSRDSSNLESISVLCRPRRIAAPRGIAPARSHCLARPRGHGQRSKTRARKWRRRRPQGPKFLRARLRRSSGIAALALRQSHHQLHLGLLRTWVRRLHGSRVVAAAFSIASMEIGSSRPLLQALCSMVCCCVRSLCAP